jgi:hypothetical protein
MKYLKYVAIVAGVALVALLAVLSLSIPWEAKGPVMDQRTIELPRGLNSNALKQSAPQAGQLEFDEAGLPAEPDITRHYGTFPPKAGIEDSDVKVSLQLDPLKMGGIYAQTYKADFTADYVIKNFQDVASKLTFYFPFPPNSGTLYDVMLQINGQEPKGVLYSGQGIQYSDTLGPGEEKPIHITYKAYGMGSFNYGLEHDRRVRKLHVVVEVKGTDQVNLAYNALMPTDRKTQGGATTYTWDLANLITSADIGIELSRRPRFTPSLAKAGRLAFPLYLGFLLALLASRMRKEKQAPWGTLFAASFAYIPYYPFLAFALPRMPALWAVLLALVPGAILAILFLVRYAGFTGAVGKGAVPLILIQGGITLAVLASGYGTIVMALALTLILVWLLWVAGSFQPAEHTT